MKTEFKFESSTNGIVTAKPEKVILNGVSGNIWTFYGYDKLRNAQNIHLGKTFMKDKATKEQIKEQFRIM